MKTYLTGLAVILATIVANYALALIYDVVDDFIFAGVEYPVYVEAGAFVASAIENGKILLGHAELVIESFIAVFGEGSIAEFLLALALVFSMLITASIYNVLALVIVIVAIFGHLVIFLLE
jgi:hypothetical protein